VELRRYIAILRRRLLLIVVAVIAGITAAYLTTPKTPGYQAQSTIYVGSRQLGALSNGFVSADQLLGLQQVILTFSKMIDSRPIAADAIDRTGLQKSTRQVLAETNVSPEQGTQLLQVQVTDPSPDVAQRLANGLADSFVSKIEAFEPGSAPQPGAVPQLPAYVFERAALPTNPQPTGLPRRLVLGALFGFVVAVGIVFLLEYLDVTIKGAADAEQRLGLPVLAVIPFEARLAAESSREQRVRARAG